MANALALLRQGVKNPAASEALITQIADQVKTMEKRLTEDLVGGIKALIKDKHCSPQQRLFALRVLNAAMKKPSRYICEYLPKKTFKRLGVLARHRKVPLPSDRSP